MSFITARLRSSMTPRIREKPVAAAQDFRRGAPLVMDANGAWAEAAADPAAIGAFAESDYGVDTGGFGGHGRKEFPPGFMQGSLAGDQSFSAEYVGALPAAAGGTYGLTRGADGVWRVDFAKTAASARLKLESIDWTAAPLNRNRVLVSVLAANVQALA